MAGAKPLLEDKGDDAEELLRDYFLCLDYYVARGVHFTYDGEDITDVDLWLYQRQSPVSRQRINVDIKNKKTPQAIERILWARGLQETLGLDQCIVATTDNRPTVVDFGRDHNVVVLDGKFFSQLKARGRNAARLTEYEFVRLLDADKLGKSGGNWRERIEVAKTGLLTHLGYDGCNGWLADIQFFIEQTQVHTQRSEAAVRSTYLTISHFLIGLDFAVSRIVFEDTDAKLAAIKEGLWHGSDGKERTESMLKYASTFAAHYSGSGKNESQIRREMTKIVEQLPVGIIAEYFSKGANINQLFTQALQFESFAFTRKMTWPSGLHGEAKAVVAVLLDFFGIERAKFFRITGESRRTVPGATQFGSMAGPNDDPRDDQEDDMRLYQR